MKPTKIIDACNEVWYWNGHRVFHLGAEIEFLQAGEDVEQNGYQAWNMREARKAVKENSGLKGEDEN